MLSILDITAQFAGIKTFLSQKNNFNKSGSNFPKILFYFGAC